MALQLANQHDYAFDDFSFNPAALNNALLNQMLAFNGGINHGYNGGYYHGYHTGFNHGGHVTYTQMVQQHQQQLMMMHAAAQMYAPRRRRHRGFHGGLGMSGGMGRVNAWVGMGGHSPGLLMGAPYGFVPPGW